MVVALPLHSYLKLVDNYRSETVDFYKHKRKQCILTSYGNHISITLKVLEKY